MPGWYFAIFCLSSLGYILLCFRAWRWILLFVRAIRRRALRNKAAEVVGHEVATLDPAEPVYETYGHPWAPIPELVAKLPRPPTNYSWEIIASLNSYNSPALRLSLLDLRTAEASDFIERDLVVIRRWRYAEDDTFAGFYRRAADSAYRVLSHKESEKRAYDLRQQALCRKVFYAHLLAPMADWATATVAHKAVTEPAALVSNYKLVQEQAA